MTVASSYSFELTRDQIVRDALTNLGVIGPDAPDEEIGGKRDHAVRALNTLVKSLDPEGEVLWRVVRRTTTTTAGTATFAPALDVLSIDQPMSYLKTGGGRQPIVAMSRDDFMNMADRTVPGTPTRFFWEKTLTTRTVTLWPIPETTGDTIEYAAVIRSRDFGDGSSTPDFPQEWGLCLTFGLSWLLAPSYGQAGLAAYYKGLFDAEKAKLQQAETENGDVTFVPRGLV